MIISSCTWSIYIILHYLVLDLICSKTWNCFPACLQRRQDDHSNRYADLYATYISLTVNDGAKTWRPENRQFRVFLLLQRHRRWQHVSNYTASTTTDPSIIVVRFEWWLLQFCEYVWYLKYLLYNFFKYAYMYNII